MVHSSQDQGWEDSLHFVPSFSLSCAEITTHHCSGRAPGREEKDTLPYSLVINLITTRLSIPADRRVLNRLSYSGTSQIGLTTSRCASPRLATSHFLVLFCYATTKLALQVQQERTQVVCSNREAQKHPARGHFRVQSSGFRF